MVHAWHSGQRLKAEKLEEWEAEAITFLQWRVTLQKFGAVPSTVHGMIKFPTRQGIATVRTESEKALCASVGGNLSNEIKIQLRDILVANMDIFSWCIDDMTGVPRSIAEHKLNANPNLTPVRLKKRPMVPERSEWLRLEVDNVVHANILREGVVDVTFKDQIGRNHEAYIDYLVIKSNTEVLMLADFLETFNSLQKINMKLNPTKCSFGEEEEGKFLGYIVTPRGIKANPKKIEAVERMHSSKSRKWTGESEKAFIEMKTLLRELPALTAPISGETLMLYLTTSKEAISSVLVADRGQVQMHVYHVSKALSGSEVNYPSIEKLVYALWAIELGDHEINYSLRTAVKGQILVDYLAETIGEVEALTEGTIISHDESQGWEFYIDGACGPEGVGAGLVLTSLDGEEDTYVLLFTFVATNNESEYEALLSEIRIVQQLGIKHLDSYVDLQLVANQVNGSFGVNEASMQRYMELVHELANEFAVFSLTQVPKGQNKKACALSKLAALFQLSAQESVG
ncbi:uncharacterized protein [Rutidosis leptorrhynchoides]|uniref:uncharacterized protein n=1 Tax=Rutidosis leptorrhynchoides TaxID=125765 RepID=UPI003A993FD8